MTIRSRISSINGVRKPIRILELVEREVVERVEGMVGRGMVGVEERGKVEEGGIV